VTGPEILTPRLRLTRLTAADVPAVHAYRADPDVGRYQGFAPGSAADVEAFVAGLADTFDTPGTWYQFGLRLRPTGELVGDLGVRFPADDPDQAELGLTLAPAHQGRGLATEAVTGALDHLFGPAGKHRVFASVDPRNAPSVALLRRAGFRQEAHFRESMRFKGAWADDLVFGILAREWRERRGGDGPGVDPGHDLSMGRD